MLAGFFPLKTAFTNTKAMAVGSILILIMVLGLALRLVDWQSRSLWQDEVFTAAMATGNPLFEATILPDTVSLDPALPVSPSYYRQQAVHMKSDAAFWQGVAHNVQMPVYPLIMRGWMQVISPDPISLRLFSLLMGTLAIGLTFLLGRQWHSSVVGLIGAAVVAISGFQLIYSQTARLYEFIFVVILLNTWLCVRLQQYQVKPPPAPTPWGVWFAFGLGSLLGLYTHYYYVFVAAFHGVWLISNGGGRPFSDYGKFKTWRSTGVCFGLLALTLIPWFPMFQAQKAFLSVTGHGNLLGLWHPLSLLERLWSNGLSMLSPKATVINILATGVLAVGTVLGLQKIKNHNHHLWFIGLWLLWGLGGLMAVDISSGTHRLMTDRYLMIVAPALYLWLAWALVMLWRQWPKPTVIIGLVLMLLMGWNAAQVLGGQKFLKKQNYQAAGNLISVGAQPGDVVIICHSGVHAAGLAFYLPNTVTMLGVSRRNPGVLWDTARLSEKLDAITKNHHQVWFVEAHLQPPMLKVFLRQWFHQRFTILDERKFSSIRVYQLRPNN